MGLKLYCCCCCSLYMSNNVFLYIDYFQCNCPNDLVLTTVNLRCWLLKVLYSLVLTPSKPRLSILYVHVLRFCVIYNIDYDERFSLEAKISYVRILTSLATNLLFCFLFFIEESYNFYKLRAIKSVKITTLRWGGTFSIQFRKITNMSSKVMSNTILLSPS